MIYFQCDYVEGGHPKILSKLAESNLEQTPGYGLDAYCAAAAEKIKALCNSPKAQVHFLVGGTQANTTVISSVLRPYQGVLAADEGHIACHETGAIEAAGHKVLPLPSAEGKINAAQVRAYCRAHYESDTAEHTVQPGMVYISFPTECGTLYTKRELEEMSTACREWQLPLFLDGARMGYGLMSEKNDLTLADIAALCDVFYIGGTKCGAMFGEAVVITAPAIQKDFRYHIKQRGGMLAKGRLLGIQFDALLEDGLYFDICKQADMYAARIRRGFEARGIPLWWDSWTNQQFPILTGEQLRALDQKYVSEVWGQTEDGRLIVRFCTSWATKESSVLSLLEDIAAL